MPMTYDQARALYEAEDTSWQHAVAKLDVQRTKTFDTYRVMLRTRLRLAGRALRFGLASQGFTTVAVERVQSAWDSILDAELGPEPIEEDGK